MTGATSFHPVLGLEALESGLHTLHRSQLRTFPEFKGMCDAINRHYTDLKLAHLTGKAKDLQEQAQRDTKFYNILTKMLCEIEGKQVGRRESLRRVHTWYMANKHVLYCGPHFGKDKIKAEAKEILRKATTPRSQLRAKSAVERNPNSPKIQSSRTPRRTTSTPRGLGVPSRGDPPPSFRLDLEYVVDYEPYNNLSASREVSQSLSGEHITAEDDKGPVGHSASPSPTRVLSRPRTAAIPRFSNSKELRKTNVDQVTPRTFKRMLHPIPSYVNPHTVLAKQCSPLDPDSAESIKPPKIINSGELPPDKLRAWQNYYRDRAMGQDLMGDLKFAGRSGTASDVRYTAHSYGESPENHTSMILKHYSTQLSPPMMSPKDPHDEESAFMQQTLEEFYQRADTILATSTKNVAVQKSSMNRIKSAPAKGINSAPPQQARATQSTKATQQQREPSSGADEQSKAVDTTEQKVPQDTGVKLNTVISVIDAVSEDMVFFKEKVAPEPQAGFHQPSTTGLPTPRADGTSTVGLDMTEEGVCPASSPLPEELTDRATAMSSASSPFASRTLIVREGRSAAAVEGSKVEQSRCKSAGLLDWRGRIQPDTMRYKWSKTRFGGHTYLKKWHRTNLRSAGSSGSATGRRRPKTAPPSVKEKWKTEKESDKNTRVVQAASHDCKQVDQADVDTMFSVQHLLDAGERSDSMDSLLDLDEEFWKNLRKGKLYSNEEPPTMEFLSFITPSAAALAEQKEKLASSQAEQQGEADDTGEKPDLPVVAGEASGGDDQQAVAAAAAPSSLSAAIHVPAADVSYDVDALNAAVSEEQARQQQQQVSPAGDQAQDQVPDLHAELQSSARSEVTSAPGGRRTDRSDCRVEVSSIPPSGRRPATAVDRAQPLQELSQSEEWRFCLEDELSNYKGKQVDHFCDVQLELGLDPRDAMTSKVQRSAGRMPSQSQSHREASSHMLAYSRRYSDALRRAPPLRTPPSIPNPQPSSRRSNTARSGSGPVLSELERHARKVRSPRNLMNTVNTLRSEDGAQPASEATDVSHESMVTATFHVCKLPTSSRGRLSQMTTDTDFDFNEQLLQSLASHPYQTSREPSFLHSIHETQDYTAGTGPLISAYGPRARTSSQTVRKPTTAPALEGPRSQTRRSEDFTLHRNSTWTSIGSRDHTRGRYGGSGIDPRTVIVGRPYSKVGRPIAQCSKVPDPDELFEAVIKQKEAAAAVDIQRIFRGYVARNAYKNLLSEEIKRKEEERIAAIKIQSMYRGHMSRQQAIYNRPPLNPELVKWSKDVKAIQDDKSQKRQIKMEALSNEMSENHRAAAQKISTIGPHVEVYDIYHPKKTGPTKRELNQAAIRIQRVVRGWMIRRKMEKLSRKATWYGSSFHKMVKEYKTMLKRVQKQHGVDKASTPFSITEMNNYIDTRRRYESVFEKKSFGGELEHGDIEAFFRECDLYPSQAEIEEALDVTSHGQASKRESKGLRKKELMDMIFYIYTPSATGLEGTRQSTWMSPIIEGQEARKLLGSEFVEPAPLAPCAKLVIDTRREQRQKEQAQKEAEERRRINEEREKREEELRKQK